MLRDAFAFTRQGVFENRGRWARLILALILLGIPLNGYAMRIYRGATTAPDVDQWGRLFIDGLKLIIVGCIYAIPIMIIWVATYGSMMAAIFANDSAMLKTWTPNMALMALMYIFEFAIAVIMPVASIRFARTNRFSEAFNFRAIVDYIGKIGWINYIVGILVVAVIVAIPVMVLVFIFIGLGILAAALAGFSLTLLLAIIALAILVILLVSPLLTVFQARYWTLLYDGGAAPAGE
jgi:hypothetical protein